MDREERKTSYLHCFIKTFAENGIDRTPIKKLAAAAKINEASIYQYFKNKDEIVVDCVGLYLEKEIVKMVKILSNNRQPFETRIRRILNADAETAGESKFIIQVLTSPAYGKMCSPLVRSFSQRFLSLCTSSDGAFSDEPVAPTELLLILSAMISYRVVGDEQLFRLQTEYLLSLFYERERIGEDRPAMQKLG